MRSLWADTLPEHERVTGSQLDGDLDVDVAIVGAGYTGLWTAYHLLQRDRSLRVAVLEREQIGFGASGRNGGWCSALLPMSLDSVAEQHGAAAAAAMQRAMYDTVEEVVAFAERRGLGDACHRGGTVSLARTRPQLDRIHRHIDELSRFGVADGVVRLGPGEAAERCNATNVIGGAHTEHCATVHPLRLVHALAGATIDAGATIYEATPVESIAPRRLDTPAGVVRAETVVRATEGYTAQFAGARRALLPIYSLMIATEPLTEAMWSEIGLAGRPTFHDARGMIIYGQRTADGRLAFGGRGAPYHFGSQIKPEFDTDQRVAALLAASLRDLFPVLSGTEMTHHWGGVLAAPRDWHCGVRYDRRTGFATAGGYVGDGVSTSHLAGRTLAALITRSVDESDRQLLGLPWLGHESRKWEPEPLRWLGVNFGRVAAARADAVEARTDRRSRVWGGIVDLLLGH